MKTFPSILFLLTMNSSASPQAQTNWDGFVTDTHCGTNCQRTSHMTPDRACVRRCVKSGCGTRITLPTGTPIRG